MCNTVRDQRTTLLFTYIFFLLIDTHNKYSFQINDGEKQKNKQPARLASKTAAQTGYAIWDRSWDCPTNIEIEIAWSVASFDARAFSSQFSFTVFNFKRKVRFTILQRRLSLLFIAVVSRDPLVNFENDTKFVYRQI